MEMQPSPSGAEASSASDREHDVAHVHFFEEHLHVTSSPEAHAESKLLCSTTCMPEFRPPGSFSARFFRTHMPTTVLRSAHYPRVVPCCRYAPRLRWRVDAPIDCAPRGH